MEFKGKIMLYYSSGVKRQQGFTTGVGFYVYDVVCYSTGLDHSCVLVNKPGSQSSGSRSFSRWEEYDLLFDIDIVNLLLKKNGGES